MSSHSHIITVPVADTEIDVEVLYTMSPYVQAVLWGDNAHPAEGGEIEITDATVWIDKKQYPCPAWLLNIITSDESLTGNLSDNTEADDEDDGDAAYERRRDEAGER